MLEKLAIHALTYVLDKLIALITRKWDEYQEDEKKKEEVKKKVKAIKHASSKEELRTAIRDLSI